AAEPRLYRLRFLLYQGTARYANSAHSNPRSLSAFGFIQDDWRVRPRLTLNLGLRYDIEKVDNVRNYSTSVDANNLQPRAGVAWEPWGRRLVIRGGAGLYTQQQLLFFINRVQLEGPDAALTIALSQHSPLFPK